MMRRLREGKGGVGLVCVMGAGLGEGVERRMGKWGEGKLGGRSG